MYEPLAPQVAEIVAKAKGGTISAQDAFQQTVGLLAVHGQRKLLTEMLDAADLARYANYLEIVASVGMRLLAPLPDPLDSDDCEATR